jgi:hypothetical protein
VLSEECGEGFSDTYAAYDQLDGRYARCWAHFLRDIYELQEQHPARAGGRVWAKTVHRFRARAVIWAETARA